MNNRIYSLVFFWLFMGLLLSFSTGYALTINPTVLINVVTSNFFYIIVILEFAVAIFFSLRIHKMKKITAIICYILYCFLTGLTFSLIFLAYELLSILIIFLVTSILFLIFALYGYFTKKDLTGLGIYLFMALIGIIITLIINAFIESTTIDLIISIVGIIIFVFFIAYDINKIKYMLNDMPEENVAIYGAFQLYLDFINIFIKLLRIFGKNRN